MIKDTEVRIGNYVKDYTGKVIKIDSRYFCGTGYAPNPIPLTPEILEKCGFEKESAGWFDKNSLFNFREFRLRDNVYSLYHADKKIKETIEYLHQLQNLYFALTSEELPVVNLVSKDNNTVNI